MNPVKTLKFFHLALLSGQVAFLAVVAFITKDKLKMNLSFDEPFVIVGCVLAVVALVGHQFLFKKSLEKINTGDDLTIKLQKYQGASIVKWAVIEASAMLCIIGAFVTKSVILLLIAGILIVYFYTLKPSKEKLFSDLELSREEKQQIKE